MMRPVQLKRLTPASCLHTVAEMQIHERERDEKESACVCVCESETGR